jgi:hypothetical protein
MTESDKPSETNAPKAPYSTPRLQTFGTFASLTRTVSTHSALADKSGGGTNKTM